MTATFERDRHADYLLRLARSGIGSAYKELATRMLAIEPHHAVLDLGCGPGADLASYDEVVTGDGLVVGADSDEAALRQAAGHLAVRPRTRLVAADVHRLPFATASFDRVHTDRVLQHVERPQAALREISRVLRPGGVVVWAEPDWRSLSIDHPDAALSDAYARFVTDRVIRNPHLGRQLPRLAAAAGLVVEDVVPVTSVFRDAYAADQVLGLERVTHRAVAAGYLGAGAADDWLSHLRQEPFFAAVTLYLVRAVAGG